MDQSVNVHKRAKAAPKFSKPPQVVGTVVRINEDPRSASESVTAQRPTRIRKRPSKFLDYVPPTENKPRAEGV